MKGVHPEQARHSGDDDVQEMLEVVIRTAHEKQRRDRHERGEQHGGERQRTEHEHGHLQQTQTRADEDLDHEERRKTHGERREEQERQLDARRHRLRGTRVRTGDEAEEAGQGDDREDGVSQLAAKPDRVDDLLEKLFSVAEQCFQEGGIARDPLIGGHGQALGVRASNLATILLFCQCLLMFDNVYNLIYVFRITGGRSVASAAATRAAVASSIPRFCASSSAARPRTRYNAASSCVSASTWRRIVAASPRATGPVSAASGPSRPRFSSVPSTRGPRASCPCTPERCRTTCSARIAPTSASAPASGRIASSRTARITTAGWAIQRGGWSPGPTVSVSGRGTDFLPRPCSSIVYPAAANAKPSPTPARPGPMMPTERVSCAGWRAPARQRATGDPGATWRGAPAPALPAPDGPRPSGAGHPA